MKYTKDFEKLGLPHDTFIFGIELEADNVNTKGKNGLYTGKSANYITLLNWHMASSAEESLVKNGGAELVSPKLTDSEQTWKNIASICTHMKNFPGNKRTSCSY